MAFVTMDDGVRLFFTDEGDGDREEVFLLVHGLGGDSNDWIWQLPALTERRRAVAVDLRGHGRSSVPASGFAPSDYASDLLALLDRLGIESVTAVGHSLGAVVVSNLARERPDVVRAAVLVDPTYGDEPEVGTQRVAYMRRFDAEQDVKAIAGAMSTREGSDTPQALVVWHQRRVCATPVHVLTKTLIGLHDSPDQVMERPRVDQVLAERNVPLLVFHSVPGRAQWERPLMQDERSEVIDWPDAGHWLHQERPEQFNAILQRWIRALDR